MTTPSPPGLPPFVSMSKSGFQLLSAQMFPAWSIPEAVSRMIGA